MRKTVLCLSLLLIIQFAKAQKGQAEVKAAIQTFFAGMMAWDTGKINTAVDTSMFLYSIMMSKEGKSILQRETKEGFYAQVAGLKGKKYEEKLLSYLIKVDGNMAIAWTPYKFFFEGNFSHCGVNVFTLIKRENGWKIMGITDTRRKQGCN